jgi:hypothetical protein
VTSRLVAGGSSAAGPDIGTFSLAGRLRLEPVPVAPPLPKSLQSARPGSTGTITTSAARGGVVIQATGAMAQGLDVEQTGRGGLPTARCAEPGTSFWFVGPGADTAGNVELYLINTDPQPADVQVEAMTDAGPLLGSSDTGITVPPHGSVVQSLTRLLHGSRVIAIHVSTSIGRVVAAVREMKSPADPGAWLAAAQPPARSQVVPGLPKSAGSRVLYVAVPGSANADVKVTAVTSRGSYQPTGGSGIELPGGSATSVQLPSLAGVAAALRVSANVPVTAAVLVPGGGGGFSGAVAAAAGAVQQQGVVADNPGRRTDLVLSAPRGAARVRVIEATTSTPAAGQAGTVVQIAAGRTVVVPLKPPAGRSASFFAVVVRPLAGSGPVYGAQVITSGGTVRSILPIASSLTSIPLPPVRDSLSAAQP